MLDVYKIHQASKTSWIKKLYYPSPDKWKIEKLKIMNTILDLLNKKYHKKYQNNISKFQEQVLTAWKKLILDNPTCTKGILNEYFLYTNSIKIGNKVELYFT